MGFRRRQLVNLLLAANANRPLGGRLGVASFFASWAPTELAPQLIGLTTLDTAQSVVRRKAKPIDVLLGLTNIALLSRLAMGSRHTADLAERSLVEALGADYGAALGPAEPRATWRQLARPFHMKAAEVEVLKNVQYAGTGLRGRLDILRPRHRQSAPMPVLVQVHGGAWIVGSKEEQGQLLMNKMASQGWICVAINYRLAPKHPWPTQIVDVKRALAWVREHIADYGGDPGHIVITGGSAGGHLASLAALSANDPAYQPGFEAADTHVDACVPFYGVFDMAGDSGDRSVTMMRDEFLAPRVFGKKFRGHEDEFRSASPLNRLDTLDPGAIPDFYVLHGSADTMVSVSQARAFVKRMREVSTRSVTYTELPGAQHAFEIFGSVRSYQIVSAVARWMEWQRAQRVVA